MTYMKGGVVSRVDAGFTSSTGTPFTGTLETGDAWGGGGGIIWEYDWSNKSYFRLFALASKGNVNFGGVTDPGNVKGNMTNAFEAGVARFDAGRSHAGVTQLADGTFVGHFSPQNHETDYRAGYELVWNVTPCFSFDTWAYWDNNNNGFGTLRTANTAGTEFTVGGGSRNLVGVGIRLVLWILDNFAIQGQAGYNYIDHNRGFGNADGAGSASHSHRGGNTGIFTIAPTIKPIGGYFTRPEIRLFATYAIWSHALDEGAVINTNGPPYNGNQNQGWLFGGQMEIWF
jgi:maltoporin